MIIYISKVYRKTREISVPGGSGGVDVISVAAHAVRIKTQYLHGDSGIMLSS